MAFRRKRWGYGYSDDRFSNYRQLVSKFDSEGKCGHPIKKGDVIGWHPNHGTRCSDCWARWSAENAEADMLEANPSLCPW